MWKNRFTHTSTKPTVDITEAAAYVWTTWKFIGLHGPSTWSYNLYGLVLNLVGGTITPVSLFVNAFVLTDLALIFNSLQIGITLCVSTVKMSLIYAKLSNLVQAREYLKTLDVRANRNKVEVKYLHNIVRQCRWVSPLITLCYGTSLSASAISGLVRGRLVYEGYFPFDWSSSTGYYLLAFGFQFATTIFQIIQNTANDAYPLIHLNTLRGHIHALGMRVKTIGKNPSTTSDENYGELMGCIEDHKTIIRLFESIRPVISQTILVQLLITAIVLCISTVYFLIFNHELAQTISGLFYITTILSEILPVCWFGNVLIAETDSLTTAIYSCNWMDQTIGFRKCLFIFMERSKLTNVILAGGIAPITLRTFIDIIRFSISMFTVLSQLK